eukprot:TRINITY_DN4014_c0_g1_i1.p1 TRINITY_DN4014_c0_g1~~TRINITY_DN4014_c0_g1_i1.p1  ORF type:complete len:832 (+),score=225.18 TRINITY_DN4014_c0_g1_i1:499-2994(+)
MNDEATTTYYEEVNQMTEGALFIQKEFGTFPKSAWHIDPFGHSAATSSLWAQIGFSNFVIDRIPYWIKNDMKSSQNLEFVWRGSKSLGNQTDMWIHVLDNMYQSPAEINFNHNDGTKGIYVQDDPTLFDMNVDELATAFATMARSRSAFYRHNKLLIPFGDDFAHRQAYNSFVNMDKMIKYVNENPKYNMHVQYAFLSDYVKAVNGLNMEWPVFEGDFFPYADNGNSFWSGFYTSRPQLKSFVRSSDALLQSAEQIYAFSRALGVPFDSANAFDQVDTLRQATSIATHHDAITGTSKSWVVDDYSLRLQLGNDACEEMLAELCPLVANKDPFKRNHQVTNQLVLQVYNPLAWNRTEFVQVLLNNSNVGAVTDLFGNVIPFQVNPLATFSVTPAKFRLFFLVSVQPLSLNAYTVKFSSGDSRGGEVFVSSVKGNGISSVNNTYFQLNLNQANGGKLQSVENIELQTTLQVSQDLAQYTGSTYNQASGAYIFHPQTPWNSGSPTATVSSNIKTTIVQGPLVTEIQQYWRNGYGQTIRLYNSGLEITDRKIEIYHEIGPIDNGMELITQFNTNLNNAKSIFTADNGLEVQNRTFNSTSTQPIAGNYFPMVSSAYIQDQSANLQLSLVSDSAHGCSSQSNGGIEVMLHRRLTNDDLRGLNQALNDQSVVTPTLWMLLDDFEKSAELHRTLAVAQQFPLTVVQGTSPVQSNFRPVQAPLPPNVHLMSFRAVEWNTSAVIVRLQHIFAVGEHSVLSQPAVVDLGSLFTSPFSVSDITEMNLTGNQLKSDVNRLHWITNESTSKFKIYPKKPHEKPTESQIVLNPMEIRTFIVQFNGH